MLESIITEVGYKIDYFNDERLNERLLKGILARIKVEDEEECWEWTGSFKKIKHPAIGYKSIKVYVADIICNLIGKPKKEYHKIERTCSNFKCFNPNHIKIVPVLKNYTFFDSIDCEEKAYWLGFILADGCVRTKKRTQTLQSGEVSTIKKGSGLEICLQEKDKKHLEKFASIFERKVTTKIVKNKKTGKEHKAVRIAFTNNNIFNSLINLGVYENKTYLDDTTIFDKIKPELMHHFIRGIFDGDGGFYTSERQISWHITGRESLLLVIQNILIKEIGLNKVKLTSKQLTSIKTLRYGGRHSVSKITKWLYNSATIYLNRKLKKVETKLGRIK